MRAIGYIRVSTEEQGQDERFSLPHQREHITQECKARGWELLAVYEDTESGKSTRKRKGFHAAMEAMQNADVLVVHELDRLSRNIIDTLIIVDELNKAGKKFISIHDNIDSSSEQGELQLHILAVFAHYFRKQLGRKVHGSMLTRAEAGQWNTKPPFGYKLVDNKLVINQDEAWIVQKIFNLYLQNYGARAIAEHLNSLGIKTRSGALWSDFPIKRMLKNEAYIGNTVWNRTKRNDTKELSRPVEEWVRTEATHEPIIDKATFQAVQERMEQKRKIGGRAQHSDYLLSGLLRCGHCGGAMIGNTNKGRFAKTKGRAPVYHRYICSNYHKQGVCHYVFAHRDQLEAKVLEQIKSLLGSPDEAKLLTRRKKTNTSTLVREQNKLLSELDNIQIKFKRQLEAYEAGIIDIVQLKEARERVKQQEQKIKNELSNIQAQLRSVDKSQLLKEELSDFYKVFKHKDVAAQKMWLQQKINRIVFNSLDDITIEFKL